MLDFEKVDRHYFSVGSLHDEGDEAEFWASRTIQERFQALEFLRSTIYGYDPATARLQRVLTVSKLVTDTFETQMIWTSGSVARLPTVEEL